MTIDSTTRRAALIATGITVPLVVVVGLLLGGAGSTTPSASKNGVLSPVSVVAPTATDAATVATCAQVISAMPLVLDGQNVRRTVSTPPSPSIVAWGNPAIVLRCGVARPKSLHPPATAQYISATGESGPYFDVTTAHGADIYTSVDRAVYIELAVPAKYTGSIPITVVATELAKTLPAVCVGGQSDAPNSPVERSKLCAYRK